MALYRTVSMSFWTDSKVVDDFSAEDRYFYLYLFTNPHTNLCGCYEISIKQAANEMGLSVNSILVLLDRFETLHNVIRYSEKTKEILLLNWHKYNWTTSTSFTKPLSKEIKAVKDPTFREYLSDILEGKDIEYPIDTVSTPCADHPDTSVTVTVTDTVSVSNTDTVKSNDSFDEFWAAYPKKVGKKDAQKAFAKAIKTVDLDTMLNAISVQKESDQWSRDNNKYIPNPSTWLNQGRWDDELAPKGITTKNGRAVRDDAFWERMAKGDLGL